MTQAALEELRALLGAHQYRFRSEVDLHEAIAGILTAEGYAFERERPLGPHERLDFYLTALKIAIEVKVAGAMQPALRQVARYLASPEVDGVLLAASRCWARGRFAAGPLTEDNPKLMAIVYLRRPI